MGELSFDALLTAALIALLRRAGIRPPAIFALYVAGYSASRSFEELLGVDPARHIVGEWVNFWTASLLALLAAPSFTRIQLRPGPTPSHRRRRQVAPGRERR